MSESRFTVYWQAGVLSSDMTYMNSSCSTDIRIWVVFKLKIQERGRCLKSQAVKSVLKMCLGCRGCAICHFHTDFRRNTVSHTDFHPLVQAAQLCHPQPVIKFISKHAQRDEKSGKRFINSSSFHRYCST